MATAVEINRRDMDTFLVAQGFQEVQVPGTKERVYSKFVDKGVCLRVYTSIVGESSRGTGEDAIRTILVTKVCNDVKIIGGDRRVHRVEGWRNNLQNRLDGWRDQLGPACPKCQGATVRRRSRKGPFWGCCKYPVCKTVQPISTPTRQPVKRAEPHQDEFDEHMEVERGMAAAMAASENAYLDRLKEKAEYARLEAEQERRAYMEEMEAELRANGIGEEGDDDEPPAAKPRPVMAAVGGDPPPANW